MDIGLAGEMDGVETAAHLRAHFDIPVVCLTAYADGATVERATRASPYGYLLKPFSDQDLHRTIEKALDKHQRRQRGTECE